MITDLLKKHDAQEISEHTRTGVYTRKNLDDAKLMTLGIAIGGAGCIIAIIIEVLTK